MRKQVSQSASILEDTEVSHLEDAERDSAGLDAPREQLQVPALHALLPHLVKGLKFRVWSLGVGFRVWGLVFGV